MSDSNSDRHDYERPGRAWVCGHAAEGDACPLGPSGLGVCGGGSDCRPVRRDDRWTCNRPKHRGGPCEAGPSPDGECSKTYSKCSPARSLRSKRGLFTLGCTAFTLGSLVLALSSPDRNEWVAPGGLTGSHGQVLTNLRHQRCAACHAAGEEGPLQWLASACGARRVVGPTQSERCLKCHEEIGTQFAGDAHGVGAHQWIARQDRQPHGQFNAGDDARVSIRLASTSSAAASTEPHVPGQPPHVAGQAKLACASCHREHHGREAQLHQLSAAQCQSCHRSSFPSFAHGHPEFRDWPVVRPSPIRFDHATHLLKHFREPRAKASIDSEHTGVEGTSGSENSVAERACAGCHTTVNGAGSLSVARDLGYESCRDCHEQPLQQSLAGGVVLLSLPMLDTETLAEAGCDVGRWPKYCDGDFDGTLSPLTQLLLLADDEARPILASAEEAFDFYSIDPSDSRQLRQASTIAWAIKRLLHELANDGQQALRRRIQATVRESLAEDEMRRLVGGLPPDLFSAAQQRWFPGLAEELKQGTQPEAVGSSELDSGDESSAPPVAAGAPPARQTDGWFCDESRYAIGFQPAGHGDTWLAAWLTVAVQQGAANGSEALFQPLLKRGDCLKCHQLAKDRPVWSESPQAAAKAFTKFAHEPHVRQSSFSNCTACHHLDPTSATRIGENGSASVDCQRSFYPIEKSLCASCHNEQGASDDCLTCHHYHVQLHGGPSLRSLK